MKPINISVELLTVLNYAGLPDFQGFQHPSCDNTAWNAKDPDISQGANVFKCNNNKLNVTQCYIYNKT